MSEDVDLGLGGLSGGLGGLSGVECPSLESVSVRFCRLGRGSAGVSGVGRKLSLRARGEGCRGLGDGVVSGCGVVGSGLLLEPADGVVEFSEGKGGSGGNGL